MTSREFVNTTEGDLRPTFTCLRRGSVEVVCPPGSRLIEREVAEAILREPGNALILETGALYVVPEDDGAKPSKPADPDEGRPEFLRFDLSEPDTSAED